MKSGVITYTLWLLKFIGNNCIYFEVLTWLSKLKIKKSIPKNTMKGQKGKV